MSHCLKLYNYENNQQDALYKLIYYSRSADRLCGLVFLATDTEVPGSIPGTTRFSE
jgi:hypothetical protein